MKLTRIFPGANAPFEGNRRLLLQGLPAGAQILSTRLTVTPVRNPVTDELFVEQIDFPFAADTGDWGTTKSQGPNWVEVDFHNRRTLYEVDGTSSGAGTPTLQADMGGAWVRVSSDGTLQSDGTVFPVSLNDFGNAALPGLTVFRFRLNHLSSIDVTSLNIRSVPANVSLSLEGLAPFWTQVGEMTEAKEVPDFSDLLQAFLETAEVENGFYVLPFLLHSDTIARLDVNIEIAYVREEKVLPDHLSEVRLPYDYSSMPDTQEGLLQVRLPAGARVIPEGTSASVFGAFQASRVQFGSTGIVDAPALVPVAPGKAQAQPFSVTSETPATAVDVLLAAVTRTARIELNILPDSDGKPFDDPLLERPITLDLNRDTAGTLTWLSASLSREFLFRPQTEEVPVTPIRYWIVLHALEGEVAWGADTATVDSIGLQYSESQGLAWRQTTDPLVPAPLEALFRLRHTPATFQMPVAFQVGTQASAKRVSLDRFQPLGRVDFALNGIDMADAFNAFVDEAPPQACPITEHLENGGFDDWLTLDEGSDIQLETPEFWSHTAGSVQRGEDETYTNSPFAYLGSLGGVFLESALSQVVPVQPGCQYEFSFDGLAFVEGAVAEINWRGSRCGDLFLSTETVPVLPMPPDEMPELGSVLAIAPVFESQFRRALRTRFLGVASRQGIVATASSTENDEALFVHRIFASAPEGATQAEIRFVVPELNLIVIDNVSLKGTANVLSTSVTAQQVTPAIDSTPVGWAANLPVDIPGLIVSDHAGVLTVSNHTAQTLLLSQTATIEGGMPFTMDVAGIFYQPLNNTPNPTLTLNWLQEDDVPSGPANLLVLDPVTGGLAQIEGEVPDNTSKVQVELVMGPGTDLVLHRLVLQNTEVTDVPFTFVAESPGEISLSDVKVAYEILPLTRPPAPAEGLCPATPPGQLPGQVVQDCCFCPCCKKEASLESAQRITTRGVGVTIGNCPDCGTMLVRSGGAITANSRPISLRTAMDINRLTRPALRDAPSNASKISAEPDVLAGSVQVIHEVSKVQLAAQPQSVAETGLVAETEAVAKTVDKKDEETDVDPAAAIAQKIIQLLEDDSLAVLINYKLSTIEKYSVDRIYKAITNAKARPKK